MEKVDPSPHLPLINRVAGQIGLRGSVREEALSEGLVIITEASKTFDNSKGPLVNWLANNIRWGLIKWLNQQKIEYPITKPIVASQDPFGAPLELKEAVDLAFRILTPTERIVLMYSALEYTGVAIADYLGVTPGHVSRIKKSAQEKMRRANG